LAILDKASLAMQARLCLGLPLCSVQAKIRILLFSSICWQACLLFFCSTLCARTLEYPIWNSQRDGWERASPVPWL